jgi:predicted transcriptional regulator
MIFKWLEKWALRRLLKRVAEGIPVAQDRLAEIWKEHKDEILEKVTENIKKTIKNILTKALEKQGIKILHTSDN